MLEASISERCALNSELVDVDAVSVGRHINDNIRFSVILCQQKDGIACKALNSAAGSAQECIGDQRWCIHTRFLLLGLDSFFREGTMRRSACF